MGGGVAGGTRVLRVGTRSSALARTQSELVAAELCEMDVRVELVLITTSGDRTQHTNLPVGDWGSGVFVKELEAALLAGDVDLAVHSLKDVPPELPPGLALVAYPKREDPADVLVTRDGCGFVELTPGARVGTSSARRVAFLRYARPDLNYVPIRGNVDTRLRKLEAGEYDAIVLARAGLARLGLAVQASELPATLLPPAPGQGALAIEARADDARVADLVRPLNDAATATAVQAERTLMRELDGGCRLPVAALGRLTGEGTLDLLGAVAATDGSRAVFGTLRGPSSEPDVLARRLSDDLRARGAAELLGQGAAS